MNQSFFENYENNFNNTVQKIFNKNHLFNQTFMRLSIFAFTHSSIYAFLCRTKLFEYDNKN